MRNNHAYTLIELMFSFALLAILSSVALSSLSSGQAAYSFTNAGGQVRDDLRSALMRMSKEVQETGHDSSSVFMLTVSDNTGTNNSDILRFQTPIVCEVGGSVIDSNADVANWGAPLTWGCTDSTCMDADNDCGTEDYEYIQYLINSNNEMVRRVLDSNLITMREDIFAQNITGFQVTINTDETIVTLAITGQAKHNNRIINQARTLNVYLRNS